MEYPSDRKAYVNGVLIAVNVLYFLYLETAGSTGDVFFMYQKGAMEAAAVLKDHEYYRLFTAMFMHFGINHLINNMLVLFVIGDNLERALGHVKYLILYLCCGIGAGWISLYFQEPDVLTVSAGASGAIFGVIGGLLYAVAVNKGRLEDLSTRQLVVMIAFSLYFGFTSVGIDNAAHISGLVLGILFGGILYRKPRKKKWNGEIDYERR